MVVSSKRTFSEFVATNNKSGASNNIRANAPSKITLVSKSLVPRGVPFKLLKTSGCSSAIPKDVNYTNLYNSIQTRSDGLSLIATAAVAFDPEFRGSSSDEQSDAAISVSEEEFASSAAPFGYCYGAGSSTSSFGQRRGMLGATDAAANFCIGTGSVAPAKPTIAAAAVAATTTTTTSTTNAAVHSSNGSRTASFSSSRRYAVPKADLVARERCFDYVVQAIDEVWARYCDTTTSAEEMVYGDLSNDAARYSQHVKSGTFHSPRTSSSVVLDNVEDTGCAKSVREETGFTLGHKRAPSVNDTVSASALEYDETGYKSEAASPAEYDTDSSECRMVSNLPDSVRLQSLKCRLARAKEDLERHYDSREYSHCVSFWRRWDMIKYSAVEVMEDDDDDDVVEATLDELEQGRCYTE